SSAREGFGGAEVVHQHPQRGALRDTPNVGDVRRIEWKRPGEVGEPRAHERLGFEQRRDGQAAGAVGELPLGELDTLVRLDVGPQRDAESPRSVCHVREVPLHHVEVEQERGSFGLHSIWRPLTSTRRIRSIRPEPPTNADANQLVSPTTHAPNVAESSPARSNPGTSQATMPSEMPFTTKMKRPSVSTVSGSVRIRITGRITALTIPRRSAETSSARQPVMVTPGTIVAAAQRPKAVITRRKKKPFMDGKITGLPRIGPSRRGAPARRAASRIAPIPAVNPIPTTRERGRQRAPSRRASRSRSPVQAGRTRSPRAFRL